MADTPQPSLMDPRTVGQIRSAADAQVAGEISGQTIPLTSQIGTLGRQQAGATKEIGSMFNTLQPYVTGQAGAVSDSYDAAQRQETSIFNAANQRLNDLRAGRAADAQALAQEMGGPVSTGEFTDSVTPDQSLLANAGATQQLHTLGYAQAGVQEARAFAGRVFPLVRTEQQARARSYYQDQVKELQDQVTKIRATKSSKVNARFNELQAQEREFQLNKATQELARLDAHHRWANDDAQLRIAQQRLDKIDLPAAKADEARLALDRLKVDRDWKAQLTQTALAEAGLTGTYKGKTTMDAQKTAAEIAAYDVNKAKVILGKQQTWNAYLDYAIHPVSGKTITTSEPIEVPALAATTGKVKDAYKTKDSSTGWAKVIKVTRAVPTMDAITKPTLLVDYLESNGVPHQIAIRMVRKRLGLPGDWVPGEADPNEPTRPYAGRH
jgi:hypothetical protein